MELIRASFGGIGNITKHGKDSIQYRVTSVKELKVIIDHFDKYPLLTEKFADYLLFKRAFSIINRKEHLTTEGLREIVTLKASMNNELSHELKSAFPSIIPAPRPKSGGAQEITDPNWLAGFASGEGCFDIKTSKSSTHKLGLQVQIRFSLTQHYRDNELIKS